MDGAAVASALLAAAVYWNTLDAGFVYDDRRAILSNPDVVGEASPSLRRLLSADFWGTPLAHSGSHGSWRPLVTLSFRANHLLGGGWHAANAALHALCAALLARLARRLGAPPLVAGAAFALHPVHCEAVAGLVGRADVAAAACSLLALLCYARHVELRDAPAVGRHRHLQRCRRCGVALQRHSQPPVWRRTIRRVFASLCRLRTPGDPGADRHTEHRPPSPLSSDYYCGPTDAALTEEENNNTLDSLEPAPHQDTYIPQANDHSHKDTRETSHQSYNMSNGYTTNYTMGDTLDVLEPDTDPNFNNYTSANHHKEMDTSTFQHHHLTNGISTSTLDHNPHRHPDRHFDAHTLRDPKQTDTSTRRTSPHQPNHTTNGHLTTSLDTSTVNCTKISPRYLEHYIRKLFYWPCGSSAVSQTCELARPPACAPKAAMSEVCSLNGLSSAFLSDKFLTPILCASGAALGGRRRERAFDNKNNNNNNNTEGNCAVSKNFKQTSPVNQRSDTVLKRSSRRAKKRKRYRVDHAADPTKQSAGCPRCGCGRGPSTSASPLPALAACVLLSACALLCKETGIAALPVCATYDVALLLARGLNRPRLLLAHRSGRRALASLGAVSACLAALVAARLAVSCGWGGRAGFSRADNPVAGEPRAAARALTLAYVPAFCWLRLLLLPSRLCFDWGMSALPMLRSPLDARAAVAAACYAALACALRAAFCGPSRQVAADELPPPHHGRAPTAPCRRARAARQPPTSGVTIPATGSVNTTSTSSTSACSCELLLCTCSRCGVPGRAALLVGLSLLALPYAPASNVAFYVGFVAAERVLYLPSAGHCLLLALGWARLRAATRRRRRLRAPLLLALALTLASLAARTVVRNRDWRDEESLFRSALHINPPKAYGNLGSVLSSAGRLQEAEWALRQALRHRPNMADVHYNLGNLLARQGRVEEAELSYRMAIQCRPSLAVAYVSLGRLLEATGRRPEAAQVYGRCARLSSDGLRDPAAHDAAAAEAGRRLAQLLRPPPERDAADPAADARDLYRRGLAQQVASPQLEGAGRR